MRTPPPGPLRRCFLLRLLVAVAALSGAALPQGDVVELEVQQAQPGPPGAIFVPQPRGAGESLDENAKTKDKVVGDVVTTVRGDKVVGRVVTIEKGKLRLTAPHFVGEVVVEASALDRIRFTPTEEFQGSDLVALSNGDTIAGQIVAVTPEAVVVESEPTGPLKVSRKIICDLAFSRSTGASLESHFGQGRMEPWTAVGSGWRVADGVLQCAAYGGNSAVVAPFDQQEAVTMEVEVQGVSGRYINCELVLCADTKNVPYGRNSVIARFYSRYFYLMYCRNGGTNSVTNRSLGSSTRSGTLRFGYDPTSGKARAWLNTMDLGEYAIPSHPTKGAFVFLVSRQPCRIKRIRVMKGIVPPSAAPEKEKKLKTHVVRFVNRDRVAAQEVLLTDGKLLLKSSFGELSCAADRVASVLFRPDGVEKPRRRKGDVWVETTAGRLTVQFDRLTPEFLYGTTPHLGEVRIRRNALRGLRFNIYK